MWPPRGDEEEQVLGALKRNYNFQSVKCDDYGNNWLTEQNRSRLEFYLHRNKQLAQWVENPKLVPRALWPDAMEMALKAGKSSLYKSLLALSGHDLCMYTVRGGKRKRS